MTDLISLKNREKERKSQIELKASEDESLRKKNQFEESNTLAVGKLLDMFQKEHLRIGETAEAVIYSGTPEEYSLTDRMIIRGKIEDIQYEPSSGKEGILILKKCKLLSRKSKIPFSQLIGWEYQPERRDAELKRLEDENKKRIKEYEQKEARNYYLVSRGDGWKGNLVNLAIPELCLLNFETARKIIENMCGYRNEWKFEHAIGRGRMTGSGQGNLEVACASDKKDRIIGMIPIYQNMGTPGSTNNPSVISDFSAGTHYVSPTFSSIAQIESPELREFVGRFYEGLYETNLKQKFYGE